MADLNGEKIFKSLKAKIVGSLDKKENIVIFTIPGLGISHEVRKISEGNENVNYVVDIGAELTGFNILDLNFDKDTNAINKVDTYFKNASVDQKFAVIINTPYILDSKTWQTAFFSSRVYSTYYHRAYNSSEAEIFAKGIDANIGKETFDEYFKLSGGIGRILKYVVLNGSSGIDIDKLIEDKDFLSILNPIVSVVSKCSESQLSKFNIKSEGKFNSSILEKYYSKNPQELRIAIEIGEDLSVIEDGFESGNRLTPDERDILNELILDNVVTREKIADIKWGEGGYDDFSDQAINKTMQRLAKKLIKYQITPIPKVGYKIDKKNE